MSRARMRRGGRREFPLPFFPCLLHLLLCPLPCTFVLFFSSSLSAIPFLSCTSFVVVANSSTCSDHDAGTGGNATARRDETQSTQRAKEEHPEAPDVVIGMQDERGQKGH